MGSALRSNLSANLAAGRKRVCIAALSILVLSIGSARAQSIEAGRKSFAKCQVCHQLGDGARNLVGPHLNNLFGRRMGVVANYVYSPALARGDRVWDEENFTIYIRDPRRDTPGTKMAFLGISDAQEIKDLIAFLKQAARTNN